MWAFTCEGGFENVNDGSGFVRRRLVVRRAEDSFLREMYGIEVENEGRRKNKVEGGRRERETDMSVLGMRRFLEQDILTRAFDLSPYK